MIEKEIIIYKNDAYNGVQYVKGKLEYYGAVFLERVRDTLLMECWKVLMPMDFNERLYKYDPEVRIETSLAMYDVDKEVVRKLPDVFIPRRINCANINNNKSCKRRRIKW